MNFQGSGIRIDDLDLPRIGALIGVGEDELHAVLEVESSGSGFDGKGRLKMLFEPHVFYRNLSGAKRAQAVSAGLAYSAWRSGNYPADSYPRILKAIAIDETAALKAASWGLGQILGENYAACGYASPQAMVADFCKDEANQLEAMIRFIKSKKLDDNLRAHDWAGFARGYNGASYAQHGYHTKLANAFAKWRKIKDTPYTPGQVKASPAPPKAKSTKAEVVVGTVAAGGTTVAINEMKKAGFSTGELIIAAGIAAALIFVVIIGIRQSKRSS